MDVSGFEVAPGIHRIEARLGDRYVACYLVVGDDDALLVDTGVDTTPVGSILPYIDGIGLGRDRLRWVVVTHADVDHMGGNAALKAAVPGAALVADKMDLDLVEDVDRIVAERYSEFAADHGIDIDNGFKAWCHDVARAIPIDLVMHGTIELRLGGRSLEIFPTPGHSPGSVSVWDATTRTAIIGDAVLGATLRTADGHPAFPPTYRDVEPYRRTIDEIARRQPSWLLTSHYPVMDVNAAADFLAESRDFTWRLERAALRALDEASGPRTTRELIDTLAPAVGAWPADAWMFLANGLIGHLEEAMTHGRVRRFDLPPVRWEAVR